MARLLPAALRTSGTQVTPEQQKVADFHRATGSTIGDSPGIRDWQLRSSLIGEELQEFREACYRSDLIGAIDALADLKYVVEGAAVTFGIDLEPFFDEVHRSNMTKVGGPVRADGKILKPDTYEPPQLLPILESQRP